MHIVEVSYDWLAKRKVCRKWNREDWFLTPWCLFLGFFWTSGLPSWASDLFHLQAHCLVSKKVSVEHWEHLKISKIAKFECFLLKTNKDIYIAPQSCRGKSYRRLYGEGKFVTSSPPPPLHHHTNICKIFFARVRHITFKVGISLNWRCSFQ